MIKFLSLKNRKGFTLPEIIAGALIITISAAGSYSAYIIARRYANKFKFKSMATNQASRMADTLRYRYAYTNPSLATDPLAAGSYNSTNDPTQGREDLLTVSGWTLNDEVDNLEAKYDVSEVWFDNTGTETAVNQGTLPFKKIVVTIKWDERK